MTLKDHIVDVPSDMVLEGVEFGLQEDPFLNARKKGPGRWIIAHLFHGSNKWLILIWFIFMVVSTAAFSVFAAVIAASGISSYFVETICFTRSNTTSIFNTPAYCPLRTVFITPALSISAIISGVYPSSISILDMTAFSGYKYVGVVLTILCSTLIDSRMYFPVCIISSLMMSLFLIKTLRRACVSSSEYSMRLQLDSMSSKRSMFIFFVSLLQLPIFLLLTYRYSRDEYNVVATIVKRVATTK